MIQALIVIAGAILFWSLLAKRFQRWRVGAPVVMVLAGSPRGSASSAPSMSR